MKFTLFIVLILSIATFGFRTRSQQDASAAMTAIQSSIQEALEPSTNLVNCLKTCTTPLDFPKQFKCTSACQVAYIKEEAARAGKAFTALSKAGTTTTATTTATDADATTDADAAATE